MKITADENREALLGIVRASEFSKHVTLDFVSALMGYTWYYTDSRRLQTLYTSRGKKNAFH